MLYNAHIKRRAVLDYFASHVNPNYADGWRTAGDIKSATGVTALEMRQLCQMFPQTFLGSSRGYKPVGLATLTEVNDNIRTLLSRAEKIMHRARSLQRHSLERTKLVSASAVRIAKLS